MTDIPPAPTPIEPPTPIVEDELTVLKRKLARREGQGGFAANVAAIKARIAELENGDGNQD